MPWIDWYNSLAKPAWTPAPATIGLIWQILYPIILISFGFGFVPPFPGPLSLHDKEMEVRLGNCLLQLLEAEMDQA